MEIPVRGAAELSLNNKDQDVLKDATFQIKNQWLSILYGDDDSDGSNVDNKKQKRRKINY